MLRVVNLQEELSRIDDYWNPRLAGLVNDTAVKLVKLRGEFIWHQHEREDELFFVLKGRLTIRLGDGDVHLNSGEMVIIPKGVEHCPVAEEEVHLMLIEPRSTLNTGNVRDDHTRDQLKPI